MHVKKFAVSSLILSMLLLTLTYGAVVRATSEDRRPVYEVDSLGLKVSIVAPYVADPGENITVTINVTGNGGDFTATCWHIHKHSAISR